MLIFAVDWSMDVVELCKKYRKDGVVAIDLAGDESMNCESYPGHKRAFEPSEVRCTEQCMQEKWALPVW